MLTVTPRGSASAGGAGETAGAGACRTILCLDVRNGRGRCVPGGRRVCSARGGRTAGSACSLLVSQSDRGQRTGRRPRAGKRHAAGSGSREGGRHRHAATAEGREAPRLLMYGLAVGPKKLVNVRTSLTPVDVRTCCGTQEAIHPRSYTKKLYTQEAIPRSYTLVGPKKLHKCLHCSTKGTGGRPRAGKRHARPPRWRAWGTR